MAQETEISVAQGILAEDRLKEDPADQTIDVDQTIAADLLMTDAGLQMTVGALDHLKVGGDPLQRASTGVVPHQMTAAEDHLRIGEARPQIDVAHPLKVIVTTAEDHHLTGEAPRLT